MGLLTSLIWRREGLRRTATMCAGEERGTCAMRACPGFRNALRGPGCDAGGVEIHILHFDGDFAWGGVYQDHLDLCGQHL